MGPSNSFSERYIRRQAILFAREIHKRGTFIRNKKQRMQQRQPATMTIHVCRHSPEDILWGLPRDTSYLQYFLLTSRDWLATLRQDAQPRGSECTHKHTIARLSAMSRIRGLRTRGS